MAVTSGSDTSADRPPAESVLDRLLRNVERVAEALHELLLGLRELAVGAHDLDDGLEQGEPCVGARGLVDLGRLAAGDLVEDRLGLAGPARQTAARLHASEELGLGLGGTVLREGLVELAEPALGRGRARVAEGRVEVAPRLRRLEEDEARRLAVDLPLDRAVVEEVA